MQEKFVIDTSTLIACERGGILHLIEKLGFDLYAPPAVFEEMGQKQQSLQSIRKEWLKGKTLEYARQLERYLDKGDAECIALAKHLKLPGIISDDRKLLRQIFFSKDPYIRSMAILGFSFLIHHIYKKGLITNVWELFDRIINTCSWQRSEVQIANYTFLKEMGY